MIDKLIPVGLVELRALPSKATAVVRYDSKEYREFVRRPENVYFGVAPRRAWDEPLPAHCLWVDIDFKDTPEPAARADLALFEPAPSYVVASGGGLHCYWLLEEPLGPEELRPRLRWLARELGGDMRSAEPKRILRVPGTLNRKYAPPPRPVVVEESWPARRYGAWEFGELAAADIKEDRAREGTASPAAMAKAREWIAGRAPAVEGEGGDDWTYKTACVLVRDLGLPEGDALALLAEWNRRCVPPWGDGELREKLAHARRYGQNAEGARDPAADFAGVVNDDIAQRTELPKNLLEKMNVWFRCVDDNGQLRVLEQRHDDVLNRKVWVRYSRQNFIEICRSVKHYPMVENGIDGKGNVKYIDAAVAWLDHWRKKETYSGVVFMPECIDEKTPDGRLNLWRGFAVKEARGNWTMLKALIYETLCAEDPESYDYVMNWLARSVQRPWEPGQVALVFKGPKGSGKSTLGRVFTKLFGQHGVTVASQGLLTGRFNAHLRDVAALFADEAFWAGDKAGEGVLKSLVTEPSIAYEGKGKDVEMGRNCVHIIMASNNDWVVPAGLERERRFAVFGVVDDRRTRQWWDALWEQANDGGLAAMLWELRRRDIARFDVFKVPQTDALAEQREHTMQPAERWLLWILDENWDGVTTKDNGLALANDIYDSFRLWCVRHDVKGHEARASETVVGSTLRRLLPELVKRRAWSNEDKRARYYFELPKAADALDLLTARLALKKVGK